MLRDYFWSLTFVAVVLFAYTALVLMKKPVAEAPRTSASVKPAAASFAPTAEAVSTAPTVQ